MKKFFAKATKPFAINTNARPKDASTSSGIGTNQSAKSSNPTLGHTISGLHPKFVVPAVPHPCPHDHLAIVVGEEGLFIRPHFHGQSKKGNGFVPYLKIVWRSGEVVEVVVDEHGGEVNWEEGVIVYGIVGMLELFSCSYLLVISSRTEVGSVIDPTHTVFGVKGVIAIPLVEDRARAAINTLASRNAVLSRPSLLPRTVTGRIPSPSHLDLDGHVDNEGLPTSSTPRVQFSTNTDVKIMTPELTPIHTLEENANAIDRPSSAQSSCSDISTPSSEYSITTAPVFKTLASRLSFWSRVSKRPPLAETPLEEFDFPMIPQPSSMAEERETLDKLMEEGKEDPSQIVENIVTSTAPPPNTNEERHRELEEKVVKECIREFTKGGMYFAYTFDITRSLQHKQEQVAKSQKQHALLEGLGALPQLGSGEPGSPHPKDGEKVLALAQPYPTLPLWRRVDKQFWWNEWLAKPFIDSGLHPYVLPIMQGYFQTAQFGIPSEPESLQNDVMVDYILISRRSRYRAGLRYQRRGIDEEANVANFVETEAIMRVERERKQNIFSYVQIRGSIPLFWTQSGYSLKPPPLLASDRTHAQNLDALGRHFRKIIPLYGPHTVINLAEQYGKEGTITQNYREYVLELGNKDVQYCEYDFHQETKGMKYENISRLIDSMERISESQGYLWISDGVVLSHQKGVFRVNCIDCLDRTNVVQSAFARSVLNKQLGAVALLLPSEAGRTEADLVFNDVWANNGDAVSRAYAGTSALKGDFTRTGKRDLSGMLNDGVNSLARMYTSTFSDWFCQAVIDFMLGYRTKTVFSEFLLKLQSTDPRDLIRLLKIRAEAIATSVSRVLPEGERLLSGWTLFAPEELNSRIGLKFEEKVLLLTLNALYIVSYDYTLEKVKLYTRIPLGDIIGISKGAYILSPLEEVSRDPEQNAGFVVLWLSSHEESRATSYSVRNSLDLSSPSSPSFPISGSPRSPTRSPTLMTRSLSRRNTLPPLSSVISTTPFNSTATSAEKSFAAFKVLPIDPARIRRASSGYSELSDELHGATTCREAVDSIVDTIHRACEDAGGGHGNFVTHEDIVSLAEAQRMTSVYAKMEYGVKRLLWLGG